MAKVGVATDKLSASSFTPSAPAVSSVGQGFVTIGGLNVLVVDDTVASHTNTTPRPPVVHGAATMSAKAGFFFTINNKAVIIDGDPASCGHAITATGFVEVAAKPEEPPEEEEE